MELIEVINSSLIIFFVSLSVTTGFSYISYKIKDRNRLRPNRNVKSQTETFPVAGIYPKMINVNTNYRIPGEMKLKNSTRKNNIFHLYSFNLSEKMHKLRLTSKEAV